jgi:HEAT repeat protein
MKHFEPTPHNHSSPTCKTERILQTLLVIAIFVGVALLFLGPPEPSYQGKRLSKWLAQVSSERRGAVLPHEALLAVRRMGTNAFPSLTRMLTERDSNFKRSLIALGHLTTEQTRHARALAAFRSLGPDAKDATPLLLNALTNKYSAPDSTVALILIGSDALSPLVRGFRTLDKTTRLDVVRAVGNNFYNYPANIPFLLACLGDDDASVRAQSAVFLGEGRGVGTVSNDPNVVQALTRALQDKDERVRAQAALSLKYHGIAAKAPTPATGTYAAR